MIEICKILKIIGDFQILEISKISMISNFETGGLK